MPRSLESASTTDVCSPTDPGHKAGGPEEGPTLLPAPRMREPRANMIRGWRVEFSGWTTLSEEQKTHFLALVGEHGGAWCGGGAEFDDHDRALRCIDTLAREFGMRLRLLLWV